jgi:hypothetical protein
MRKPITETLIDAALQASVHAKEPGTVPVDAGDGAGDRGKTAKRPTVPFEALRNRRDPVQDPAVLAHEHGATSHHCETRRSRGVGLALVSALALAILPAPKRRREDRASASIHVADVCDLLAPVQDPRHERSWQGLRRVAADDGPPAPTQEFEVEAIEVASLDRWTVTRPGS